MQTDLAPSAIFAPGIKPRSHYTHAAKAALRDMIRNGRPGPRAAVSHGTNRFGRPYLPVEKGVPLPDPAGKTPSTARPWALLDIGESFFEAAGSATIETLTQRIKWDAKAYRPKQFTLAEVVEGGQPGLRVWRVA